MKKRNIMTVFYPAMISLIIGLLPVTVRAQDKVVWIDVRSEGEWNKGHLKNAVLIPYDKIYMKIHAVAKNKRQPINLYSDFGRRAEIAQKTLEQMGYINVQNRGGYQQLRQTMP